MKKKSYRVTTFEELRRRLREAQERAQKEAPKEERGSEQDEAGARSWRSISALKETGQKNDRRLQRQGSHDDRDGPRKGQDARRSGGMVMTSDSWLGPAIPAMKELADFERRYWKAIAPEAAGHVRRTDGRGDGDVPDGQAGHGAHEERGRQARRHAARDDHVFEAVKTKEQIEQGASRSSGGGLGGMLARRMMQEPDKPRATIFTVNTETLEVATSGRRPRTSQIPRRLQGEEVGWCRGR